MENADKISAYGAETGVESAPAKRGTIVRIRGFTLVEVLVALAVLSIALLAILRGSLFNIRSSREAVDLTTAVMAAESILKEEMGKGYPESGTNEGEFEEEYFEGYTWKKTVEVIEFPYIEELKLVTVEVMWGKNGHYSLRTVLSRY